jgi:hypothetical protein
MRIVFPITESALQTVHQCQSRKEGEWTIYTCKQCPGYERKIHRNTGRVQVKGGNNFSVDHITYKLK